MKPIRRDGEGGRVSVPYDYEQLREFIVGVAARAARKTGRGFRTQISLDEMVARNRSLVDRVRPIVNRVVSRLRARFLRK